MKTIPTLRERVSQISIWAFVITIMALLTSFTLYSMKKAKIAEEHVIDELKANVPSQINQFVPSFILPEQRYGITLLLDKLKKSEGLNEAKIITSKEDLPINYADCILDKTQLSTCSSTDLNSSAVIIPLTEAGDLYGFLLKSKSISSPDSLKNVLQMAGLIISVIGLVFLGLYIFVIKLLSTTLPTALDNLIKQIEADLNGTKTEKAKQPFKELDDIQSKLFEIIDRYNSSRDQAIIGQLTSGIMHDIKTPLQSIVSAMHLVDEQEVGSKKRLSRLENAHLMNKNNLPVICNIIETTLDGNRSIKINKQEVDMIPTIGESIILNSEMAKLRGVEILKDIPAAARIPHDDVQFLRVMNNLLKNGIEAASESKDSRVVSIGFSETENGVRIIVEDSGAGFTVQSDKIFKAFRTSKLRGTGLGLVITKKIVEAHGGSISAGKSIRFGGAQMEVILPIVQTGIIQ